MKSSCTLLSVFTCFLLSAQNSQQPPVTLGLAPVIWFNENPVNHNMHITSDGNFYYTINGGSSSGQVGKFTLAGAWVQNYSVPIDGRGLSYNFADGFIYASTYGGNVVKINDLNTGSVTTVFPGIMQNSQASFAISPDGSKFYDFFQGNLEIHDMTTGTLLGTLSGLSFGSGNYGGEAAVAVTATNIFTWNSGIKTVYAYDLTGNPVQTTVIDSGDNGHSIAIANGLLFVSRDGNYSTGTWYGYNVNGILTGMEQLSQVQELHVFPNPSAGILVVDGSHRALRIYDVSGELVYSTDTPVSEKRAVDLSTLPLGIYFLRALAGDEWRSGKVVIQ